MTSLVERLRPANSLEWVPDAPPAPADRPAPPDGDGPRKKALPHHSEPAPIAERFYVEERRDERLYYEDYKKTNLVLRATEHRIRSQREDRATVRAMLDLAEARGWRAVAISGTAEFRREAWIEAASRGLEGRGYTPSDLDRQEAERRQAARRSAPPPPAAEPCPAEDRGAPPPEAVAPPKPSDRPALDPSRDAAACKAPARTAPDDPRRAIREARRELSPDGRLVMDALSAKIERQMDQISRDAKAELKAFVGQELVKKEWAEGPIVLSAELKRVASAPPRQGPKPPEPPAPALPLEPEPPVCKLGR